MLILSIFPLNSETLISILLHEMEEKTFMVLPKVGAMIIQDLVNIGPLHEDIQFHHVCSL